MRALSRTIAVALVVATTGGSSGCKGDAGVPGNPGPEGPAGPMGPAGVEGPTGPMGERGMDGHDGREGGTPFLLTNPIQAVLQYGDGNNIIEIGRQQVIAPDTGSLVVRAFFRGTVTKRDGGGLCRVTVSVRRDQEGVPLVADDVGISSAPVAGALQVSVSTALVGRLDVAMGQPVTLHMELRRRDDDCASGMGAVNIATIVGQLEIGFYRQMLSTQ